MKQFLESDEMQKRQMKKQSQGVGSTIYGVGKEDKTPTSDSNMVTSPIHHGTKYKDV